MAKKACEGLRMLWRRRLCQYLVHFPVMIRRPGLRLSIAAVYFVKDGPLEYCCLERWHLRLQKAELAEAGASDCS